jgi:hypothetical protein
MPQTIANVSIRVLPFAELDAYLEASTESFPQTLAFVVADLTGMTFSGRVEVLRDGDDRLVARVIECRRFTRTPDVLGLVELAQLVRSRISLSIAQERLAATPAIERRRSAAGYVKRRSPGRASDPPSTRTNPGGRSSS